MNRRGFLKKLISAAVAMTPLAAVKIGPRRLPKLPPGWISEKPKVICAEPKFTVTIFKVTNLNWVGFVTDAPNNI